MNEIAPRGILYLQDRSCGGSVTFRIISGLMWLNLQ